MRLALKKLGLAVVLVILPGVSAATVIFDNWYSNESPNGNYIVTIQDVGNQFDINVTVSPWNAEVLGLFLDFGNVTVANATALNLTNVLPAAPVSLEALDTAGGANVCGNGCSLNGLAVPLIAPDGDWEAVFRLGDNGFDGIQTFAFQINDLGLGEGDIKLVGIRAQVLCPPGGTLDNGNQGCGGSDKAYSPPGDHTVPEPGSLALLALALLGAASVRRGTRS